MDKRTILAIVISVVIFGGWMIFQMIFQPKPGMNIDNQTEEIPLVTEAPAELEEIKPLESKIVPVEESILNTGDKRFETDKFEIVFTTTGGLVKSFKLKEYSESNKELVDMVFSNESGLYPFGVRFGDLNTENVVFNYKKSSDSNEITFSRNFKLNGDESNATFLLKKIYKFYDNQYLFDLRIMIETSDKESIPMNFDETMYTLNFGPQIGPAFEKLDGGRNGEYRRFPYFSDGKRRQFKVSKKTNKINKIVNWAAIEGKYFVAVASMPSSLLEKNTVGYDNTSTDDLKYVSTMFFNRPSNRSSVVEDPFQFYIGPKKASYLKQYEDLYFNKVIKTEWYDFLVGILKWLLVALQSIVKNWGVAIILMTIIIKLLFFPLTQKGLKSNSKLQSLAPKVNELKEKYKDDQQKISAATMELYKKEGVNPMGGCLPMLIQMPIFFGLYGLLSTHFELRGAVFIPGWIENLAAPETFITLPFPIPLLGWSELRLLPFIMLGMTFIQQKFSSSPGSATGQMKIMLYAMPLVFFFILYNMPSGLVVYWTMQNLLGVFQQVYINNIMKKDSPAKPGFFDKLKKELISRSKK